MPVADTPENMGKCLCMKCPSFAGPPGFYCAKGKAKKVDKKGCICMTCKLWKENKLSGGYFCVSGRAP
ncbi:MAG: DUF2769 domain-containing protein [Methanobacteriota archaeon]